MAKQITTTRALYKFLMRETKKLPEDAGKFYSGQIRAVSHYFSIYNFSTFRKSTGIRAARRRRRF